MVGISGTRSVALGAHTGRWGGGVSTITFVGELDTSVDVALAHAVIDTLLNGHITGGGSDGECASTKVITIYFREISREKTMAGER